ncbi:hypothetical protein C2S53_001145 [Perilla frutescens var. hirtella]|uniref:Brf1 TBP-binding domain-containing protein n=1 Tax=Perilla frutescens var. hirtella TaxID=608512 RepID=A0AAD4JLZ7_PERFH|nr:hypothetical protein C2S53_001145 [Perilla frutescens var. hirtella]
MAVTQEADANSKKTVEEPVQHCGREGADAGRCGLSRKRISDGSSTRPEGIRKDNCGAIRNRKRGGNIIKAYKSDKLSDIDDIEIAGYIRTKEEIHIKRILWEATNEKYIKAKKQKQAAGTKKAASVKKATKATEKVEPEKRSSRINYDALKSLDGDLGSCESAQTRREDCYGEGPQNSPDGNISPRMQECNERWDEEDECDSSFGNNGSFENYENETHYDSGDEDYCNDFD